jgi:hypothetical protein
MSLVFPNVAVLGLTRDARFFEAGFEYASFRRISIAGTINDLTETFGITGVWDGPEGVLATIRNNQNYQPLILNGVNFGSGRIENMTFEPGLDVRLKGYQADLLVYDSGNLFNFTGEYYSGIDTSNFPNLNAFSETWGFDRKLNGGYAYTQNATIQFVSGSQNLFAIGAAQSLARTLFTGSNLGFAFYPGLSNKQGKRYITESYNLITNECSFQSTFEFDNNLGAYSATYTNSVQLDDQGVMTATENGNIRGIENPNYQIALTAVATEMTGSYLRCSGAANVYFPTGAVLVTSPVSQGRAIDIFNNNIDYTVVFNNSPVNQRTYFWDYSLQASRQDGISTVVEQGSVIGRGENETTAFNNARAGFNTVKIDIPARCAARFVAPYLPATNYLENKNESFAPVRGRVGYSYAYSNDPTLRADVGVRRMDVSVEEGHPVYSWNSLGIFNYAEVVQNDYQATQGAQTVSVVLEGDKTVGLANMLPLAVTEINNNAPIGLDRYVGAASYSYDINQNATNVSVTWLYNLVTAPSTYPS